MRFSNRSLRRHKLKYCFWRENSNFLNHENSHWRACGVKLASLAFKKCWWITLNSENGLNSDCQWQMRWAYLPVIIERRVEWPMENMKTIFEATRALSVLFFKSRPGGGPALKPHRRPFQATFLSSIFFQTGDKKPPRSHSKLPLKSNTHRPTRKFCVSSFRIMFTKKFW